jgi:hypothetical protein
MYAAQSQITWWLDSGALPDRLVWARLSVSGDGSAEVLDCDGNYHRFENEQAARLWLNEDEYSGLAHMIEDGEVPSNLAPPNAPTDSELVKLMLVINAHGLSR